MDEHGDPESGKQFALERDVRGRIDLVIPKILDDPAAADRPVVRSAEGHHAILDVDFAENDHEREVVRSVEYTLRPYDELERLPLADGSFTSMFHDNGLVKGAQRLEGVFFTPIGILSAGQPRQRGTQLIHWDQYDLDDPRLFERGLRLPASFMTRCTNRSSGSHSFIAAQ